MNSTIDINSFAKRLANIPRNQKVLLGNLFESMLLTSGNTRSVRLYAIKADGNNRPQVGQLVRNLCDITLDYCIPRKKITEAVEHFKKTGSTQKVVALNQEARSLFTDISNTGEGGELLLFILTESILCYPQALSKMSLKTSSQMHYHGLDGVYISCSGTPPCLCIHFGESKLHKSPASSVREAVKSIADMLKDEGFLNGTRRDFYLLNTQADLGSEQLEEALLGFLDPIDERYLAPQICAVLLAGHEVSDYPIIRQNKPMPEELIKKAKTLIDILSDEAIKGEIDTFHIDMFLVPFPDISSFRTALLEELGLK